MIVVKGTVLTQTLALLPPPLVFGTIPGYFHKAVWSLLSSSSELKISYTCSSIQYLLFICYSTAPQPLLCHYQGHSLTYPMLITAFSSFFDSKVAGNLAITNFKNLRWITNRPTDKQIDRQTSKEMKTM